MAKIKLTIPPPGGLHIQKIPYPRCIGEYYVSKDTIVHITYPTEPFNTVSLQYWYNGRIDELTFSFSSKSSEYLVNGERYGRQIRTDDIISDSVTQHPYKYISFLREPTEDDFNQLKKIDTLQSLSIQLNEDTNLNNLKKIRVLDQLKHLSLSGEVRGKLLKYISDLNDLKSLSIPTITDESVKWIASLEGLRQLSFVAGMSKKDITEKMFPKLKQLKNLNVLDIRGPISYKELKHLHQIQNLKVLNIFSIIEGKELEQISHLTNLRSLAVLLVQATDEELSKLRKLSNLRHLKIGGKITDKFFKTTKHLTKLRYLDLSSTNISDENIDSLTNLKNLRVLRLPEEASTDRAIKKLKSISTLRTLHLDGGKVTDQGASYLGHMQELRAIDMSDTQITDKAFHHIRKLKHLLCLDLEGTNISDEGINKLSIINNLRHLYIRRTNVTETGLRDLKNALSGVKIYKNY